MSIQFNSYVQEILEPSTQTKRFMGNRYSMFAYFYLNFYQLSCWSAFWFLSNELCQIEKALNVKYHFKCCKLFGLQAHELKLSFWKPWFQVETFLRVNTWLTLLSWHLESSLSLLISFIIWGIVFYYHYIIRFVWLTLISQILRAE